MEFSKLGIAFVDPDIPNHKKIEIEISEKEEELIEEAKALLIEGSGYTEQQAHQALQRMSMRLGIKMTESARRVLNGESLP